MQFTRDKDYLRMLQLQKIKGKMEQLERLRESLRQNLHLFSLVQENK